MQDSQESSESMDSSATINGQDGGDLDEQDPFDNNEFLNHAWLYNIAIPDNLYPQGPLLISPLFKKKSLLKSDFLYHKHSVTLGLTSYSAHSCK